MKSKVILKRCKSYDPQGVYSVIKDSIGLLGGIENFVGRNDKVLLKPNLLLDATPEQGVDTHKEIVRAVAKVLKDKCAKIYLGDGPSVWGEIKDIDRVFDVSGMREVAESEGIELVNFDSRVIKKGYPVTDWVDKVDKIINLAKFKTHDLMVLTGAIKNLFGVIPGLHKKELHKNNVRSEDFAKVLVDIFEIAKPTLSVVDAVVCMEGDGPGTSGTLKDLGLILMGEDAASIDSVLALLMHLRPENILTNLEAFKRGLGNIEMNNIEIIGERLADVMPHTFKLPTISFTQKIPKPLINIVKKLVKIWPSCDYDKCIKCGKCVEACPTEVISFDEDKKIQFDYSGCIRCFCCRETCPNAAIFIKRSAFAKILGY